MTKAKKKAATKKPPAKATAKNENAKPSKKKQLDIPGTERKRIAEIDDAAEAYRVERNKRQEQSKVEKAKKQELMAVARKHDAKLYVYEAENGEEFEVEYTADTKENVKVTKAAAAEGEDE